MSTGEILLIYFKERYLREEVRDRSSTTVRVPKSYQVRYIFGRLISNGYVKKNALFGIGLRKITRGKTIALPRARTQLSPSRRIYRACYRRPTCTWLSPAVHGPLGLVHATHAQSVLQSWSPFLGTLCVCASHSLLSGLPRLCGVVFS